MPLAKLAVSMVCAKLKRELKRRGYRRREQAHVRGFFARRRAKALVRFIAAANDSQCIRAFVQLVKPSRPMYC